ncbi:TetR/AcrR family transcriptional regulator [Rothia nasisuis]|uniref:TetR/AcrR family transcriptional regulator n=1 Tax=Rothia nasisuis TaxID=2109647 RepID=UPI001F311B90|nr:TetR/AcrR family transcriptional regulator [Rothia nasisuis]
MPRLTEETRLARRSQIVEAATACFARRGYAAISMADVIKESGMSSGSIYSHFSSKEEILRAAIDLNVSFLEEAIRAVSKRADAPVTPRQIFDLIAAGAIVSSRPAILVKLWPEMCSGGEVDGVVADALLRLLAALADQLQAWADAHAPAGTGSRDYALTAANKVLTLVHGFALRSTIDPTLDRQAFLKELATMLPG